jgi:hypothetical protein
MTGTFAVQRRSQLQHGTGATGSNVKASKGLAARRSIYVEAADS